jgi:hypothetical protein
MPPTHFSAPPGLAALPRFGPLQNIDRPPLGIRAQPLFTMAEYWARQVVAVVNGVIMGSSGRTRTSELRGTTNILTHCRNLFHTLPAFFAAVF